MAYQTGTITNSHELVNKIFGFLIGIGWELHSTLQADENNDGYDFVFKSLSTSGNRDVYIRIGAGLSDAERIATGDIQHPYSDGYTEYVNSLAYQYFPPGGTKEQGLNELGVFGPIIYGWDFNTDTIYEFNIRKSENILNRNREIIETTAVTSAVRPWNITDGQKYFFVGGGFFSGTLSRLNLYDNSLSNLATSGSGSVVTNGNYISDKNGDGFIYAQIDSSNDGLEWQYYNVTDNTYSFALGESLKSPPWTSPDRGFGFNVTLVRRKRTQINGFDHFRYIVASQGYNTPDIAIYNIDTDTWTERLSPNPPFNLGSSSSGQQSRTPNAVVVTKEMSGYEYDRLYVTRGGTNTQFFSIALGDDGYYQSGASWVTHASTPGTQLFSNYLFYYDGALYFTRGQNQEDWHRWDLPPNPEDAGSWVTIGSLSPSNIKIVDNSTALDIQNHLCSKVRISEFQTNTYWLLADLDRLVVVVKDALGRYTYMYTGLFETYYDERTTTLSQDVSAGSSRIGVENPDLFSVDQSYVILDNTGASVTISPNIGNDYDLAPSEVFRVLGKQGNELLISKLNRAYSSGSLVGQDPLPLMVRATGSDKAQTLNNINKVDDDDFTDTAWQYYRLRPSVDNSFANATDVEERSLGSFLYGILLIDEGDQYTGKEVRGQLKNVFSVGTAISSEDIVAVGSRDYIAFNVDDSLETQRIVIGPIT